MVDSLDPILDRKEMTHDASEELPRCEYCDEPSDDLAEVVDEDRSVGYYDVLLLCASCRERGRKGAR